MEKTQKISWYVLIPIIAVTSVICYTLQNVIGTMSVPDCGIGDRLQEATGFLDAYFLENPRSANLVLSVVSLWYDFCIALIIIRSFTQMTIRPYLSLFIFFALRQTLQLTVGLPIPEGIIWHDPGILSFFIFYGVSHDLYFSAQTGISLLCVSECMRIGKPWLTRLAFCFFLFLLLTVIVFRIHYTTDVYTAVLTAFLSTYLSQKWAPSLDEAFARWARRIK